MISIIIPVLNEEDNILSFLQPLQKFREQGLEVVVIDGGSTDSTVEIARAFCDVIDITEKGRAKQMNAGANKANGDILLFLHADTFLPGDFMSVVEKKLFESDRVWGRFDINLSGSARSLRVVEFFVNLRSRWTGVATGDQAIFIKTTIFRKLGGYQNIPLMEDVALSKSLKKISPPLCLKDKVITSSRRWEKFGVWRTIFLMWQLRLAYFFGADPHQLAAKYN